MSLGYPSRRAQDLFLEARVLPAETRDAWLRETCGTDESLRQDVDALLASDRAGDALEPPSPSEVRSWFGPAALSDVSGRRVGSCRLVRPIAEGGMGRVYEAVQEPPGRRVAVKLLRLALPDAGSRARFEEEARLLAAVDHPGVCRIHEAGTWEADSGEPLPYCVMELVEDAQPVTAWAVEHGLSLADRVRLMVEICAAVQASHAKGVLHRDLKPANILVGRDGRPKVIDFGIARSLAERGGAHPRLTRSGMVLGTPAYMSPEQLLARPEDVDVRTDVHALGVVLYEMLTGRLPRDFGDGSLLAAVDALRNRPPTPPERYEPRVARDLSAVVQKAIDAEAGRRYASIADFAADLAGWLDHRPVTARVAGPLRTTSMWVGRHRGVSALAAALVLTLAGAAVVATLSARRERTSREAAEIQRTRVEGFLRQSREFVPWLLTDHQRGVAGLPRSGPVVRSLAKGVREHLAALSYDRVNDPALLLTASQSYVKLANVEGGFGFDANGLRAEAREDAETSIRLARRSRALEARSEAFEAEAEAEMFLARVGQFEGDLTAATAHAEAAARVLDESDEATGGRPSPSRPTIGMSVAVLRGDLRLAGNDAEGALASYRKAFDAQAATGHRAVSNATLFELFEKTARVLLLLGRAEEAAKEIERLETLGGRWERQEVEAYGTATDVRRERYRALAVIGDGAYASGKISSLPYFALALGAIDRWREVAPADRAVDREEAQLRKRVGAIQLDERRYEEAAVSLERATVLSRRLVGEDPMDVVSWQIRLEACLVRAEVEQRLGRADESERRMSEGEEISRHIGKSFPNAVEAWLSRCRVVLTRGALDTVAGEAEPDEAKARALLERAVARTLEGGALYREAVKHGLDAAAGLGVAAACDAEVARLRAALDALGGK